KRSLVLDWDQRALRPIVHRHSERFGQRAQWLQLSLNAHVTEDEEPGRDRCTPQCRIRRHEVGDTDLRLNAVAEEVNDLDMQVRPVQLAREPQLVLAGGEVRESDALDARAASSPTTLAAGLGSDTARTTCRGRDRTCRAVQLRGRSVRTR